MPGTILVSALDLVDLPSSSCHTDGGSECGAPLLKVSVGKKVYQSNGRDFSIPVVSLRENLVISLHDADGNEISQKEIKTMEVMEKGLWDAWFPLEGGGNAHLKLQFSISERDKNRVNKMREFAQKRQYANLPIGSRMHSSPSEETDGSSMPNVATKFIQLGLHDDLQKEAPEAFVPGHKESQVHAKEPSHKDEHDVARLFTSVKDRQDGEQTLGKKLALDDIPANNVKKMMAAFEGVSPQESVEQTTQSGSKTMPQHRRMQRTSILEKALFTESDDEKAQSGEIMTKSYSGMLPKMEMERLPSDLKLLDEKKREENTTFSKGFHMHDKSMVSEENQKLKGVIIPKINVMMMHIDEPMMQQPVSTLMLSNIESGQHQGYMESLEKKDKEEFKGFVNKMGTKNENKVIESKESQNFKALPSKELKVIDDCSCMQDTKSIISDNNIDSSERTGVPRLFSFIEPKENVQLLTYEQQSVPNKVENIRRSSRDEPIESSACRTSNQLLDFDTRSFLLGYADICIKRRVCITTSTKEFLDITGGFDVSVETCSRSNLFEPGVSNKHMEHGSSCSEVIKDELISCCPIRSIAEGSVPFLKNEGKLIGQIVRITMFVVTCGMLILKGK